MIVVTGGAGFIGSNLVAALEAAGQRDLVVCDWLGRDEKWRNIAKRDLADLIAPEDLFDFLDARRGTIETIFHMGAISATTETDADLIARTNIELPQRLWHWCAGNGARLIYASSAATYGDGSAGFEDSMGAAGLARLHPLNAYGWSKLAFDRRVARFVEQAAKPPQWAGLRFFNVYGPNEYHKGGQMSVVPQIYNRVAAGQAARLFRSHHPDYEDGGQLRDFIAVEDCVDVMLWLHGNPTVSGLFNCGTGAARSFRDLAEAVFQALGQSPNIEYVDTPEAIRAKYQYFTQADMAKLRRAGYDRQFTALEAGVSRYVLDYLAAEDPYR
ncbi:ADP-glyceromanno-heptose 6-epimerase [Oceanibaculum nanhaiense]|uniref:ADP-glyceromanno-heptose 6-epimerase n=1 Tax=Oceanibaculum nanhaiense TaxID=1909734 RepID=UPI00396D9748